MPVGPSNREPNSPSRSDQGILTDPSIDQDVLIGKRVAFATGSGAWADYALVDTAEQAGRYLSGQDMNSVIADTQSLARRNPGAFLGGAAALGFVLARAGKATIERADTDRIARAAKGEPSAQVRTQTAGAYKPGVAPTPIAPARTGLNEGNV